jgi:hypothetical protein
MKKQRFLTVVILPMACFIGQGCATPKLRPAPLPDARTSGDGFVQVVEKEGIVLEVSQGRNPPGSGSEMVTFDVVAYNPGPEEVELLIDRAVLIDGMGNQYQSMMVQEFRSGTSVWATGSIFYERHSGGFGTTIPIAVPENASFTDRNFPTTAVSILPRSQIRGCFFFPCRIKNTTYVRLLITRLIREKDEPGSTPNTLRVTYRKVNYEFEFDVVK